MVAKVAQKKPAIIDFDYSKLQSHETKENPCELVLIISFNS